MKPEVCSWYGAVFKAHTLKARVHALLVQILFCQLRQFTWVLDLVLLIDRGIPDLYFSARTYHNDTLIDAGSREDGPWNSHTAVAIHL